jgi:hypothetical protein
MPHLWTAADPMRVVDIAGVGDRATRSHREHEPMNSNRIAGGFPYDAGASCGAVVFSKTEPVAIAIAGAAGTFALAGFAWSPAIGR